MSSIKEMVSGNKKVKFTHYKDAELWYATECGFAFPVPISEAGNAAFYAEDKALLFMRYIRKYIEKLESAKKEQNMRYIRKYIEKLESAKKEQNALVLQ